MEGNSIALSGHEEEIVDQIQFVMITYVDNKLQFCKHSSVEKTRMDVEENTNSDQ